MKKNLLFTTFLLLTIPSFAQEESKPDLKDAYRLIDTWLEAQLEYDKLPGISVAIVKDQEILWSRGYGQSDLQNKVTTTPGTIYSICSISKLFTSVAIMQLYEAGKLRLDDSVSALLPAYKVKQQYKDSGPITIRSLLTHSSGLPRESNHPYWTGPDFPFPTEAQVNEGLPAQETLYPASTRFQYSNLGMSLLGEIVAEVSGKPYEVYVQENILTPLRLASTKPSLPANEWGKKFATGYSSIKRDGTRDKVNLFDARGITAAAGYSSTVEDLARFASWQFRLLENGGKEILKASTLRDMHRVHWVDPNWRTHWGLGFSAYQLGGTNIVGHGGSCPGYRSTLMMDTKDKWGFIVMVNAGGESPEHYAREIRKLIMTASKEKDETPEGVNLEPFAGFYNAQPWGSEEVVLPWYGKLLSLGLPSESPDDDMTLIKHIKGDTFKRMRDDDSLAEEIVFERDAAGKITRYVQHNNYSKKLK
jgi:CubicO group peptidase (beta-lactamase class C family)